VKSISRSLSEAEAWKIEDEKVKIKQQCKNKKQAIKKSAQAKSTNKQIIKSTI